MAVDDVIRLLECQPAYTGTVVVHTETIEPELPRYGTLDAPLGDSLASYLDQHRHASLFTTSAMPSTAYDAGKM
ncbi:MAG: hypothetical protein MZV63_60090 [Marinilabiliales bacterium]|nr:hypothetical protein [Marinilabiliales bacterium]